MKPILQNMTGMGIRTRKVMRSGVGLINTRRWEKRILLNSNNT